VTIRTKLVGPDPKAFFEGSINDKGPHNDGLIRRFGKPDRRFRRGEFGCV